MRIRLNPGIEIIHRRVQIFDKKKHSWPFAPQLLRLGIKLIIALWKNKQAATFLDHLPRKCGLVYFFKGKTTTGAHPKEPAGLFVIFGIASSYD